MWVRSSCCWQSMLLSDDPITEEHTNKCGYHYQHADAKQASPVCWPLIHGYKVLNKKVRASRWKASHPNSNIATKVHSILVSYFIHMRLDVNGLILVQKTKQNVLKKINSMKGLVSVQFLQRHLYKSNYSGVLNNSGALITV